jgi:hypothetical protein
MKLSLSEAATVLGKSERQVRYLIKQGTLQARKENGRWTVSSEELPLSDVQRRALAGRVETAREAFQRGLEPAVKATDGKGAKSYSVRDLAAFQAGEAILRELDSALGPGDPARGELFAALTLLARGCHSFQPATKAARYVEAREAAATAVTYLFVGAGETTGRREEFGRRIEQQLIPGIAKLVALHERRSQRSRFERYGSAVSPPGQAP